MRTRVFNRPLRVVEGWYWVLPSRKLRRGTARAVSMMGRDLVVHRTADGRPVVMEAYCPHMGAHLALGTVDGDCLRCFFHNWAFAPDGTCTDVPSLEAPPAGVRARTWPARERHGLVWVWTGSGPPDHEIPAPPELDVLDCESALGRRFRKKCHPNVVMINAIDEQHFRTVHRVPGHLMRMEASAISDRQIQFANTARVPTHNAFFRWASRFYRGPLFYQLNYWYGSNGVVSMGPDFLHLYIMFALRQTAEGATEGQTVVFTRRRRGPLGWCLNRILLFVTRLAGNYFSVGDTKVFQTIRFRYRTPVPADGAVQAFIRHLEQQPLVSWAEDDDDDPPENAGPPVAATRHGHVSV